jgi:hypothetical protein
MTDHGDKEILQMADEIRRKQSSDKAEIQKNIEQEWFKSMLGRYFIDTVYRGAHDEAFRVFWVRDIDWSHYLKIDEIEFAHIGHFHMGESSISYDKRWEFDDKYWKEIDEITFLEYIQKYLKLTGWKEKLEKETDH